jgi:hypothetical protein
MIAAKTAQKKVDTTIFHWKQDLKVTKSHFQHLQGTQGPKMQHKTLRPPTYMFDGQPPNTIARIFS